MIAFRNLIDKNVISNRNYIDFYFLVILAFSLLTLELNPWP
jgi:hypothetical protein